MFLPLHILRMFFPFNFVNYMVFINCRCWVSFSLVLLSLGVGFALMSLTELMLRFCQWWLNRSWLLKRPRTNVLPGEITSIFFQHFMLNFLTLSSKKEVVVFDIITIQSCFFTVFVQKKNLDKEILVEEICFDSRFFFSDLFLKDET